MDKYKSLIKSLENKDLTNALDVLKSILESKILFDNDLNKVGEELKTELYDNCLKAKGCEELYNFLSQLALPQEEALAMYSEYL